MSKGRVKWNVREWQGGRKVLRGVVCLFVTDFPLWFVFCIYGSLETRGGYILPSFIWRQGLIYQRTAIGYVIDDGFQHLIHLSPLPEL